MQPIARFLAVLLGLVLAFASVGETLASVDDLIGNSTTILSEDTVEATLDNSVQNTVIQPEIDVIDDATVLIDEVDFEPVTYVNDVSDVVVNDVVDTTVGDTTVVIDDVLQTNVDDVNVLNDTIDTVIDAGNVLNDNTIKDTVDVENIANDATVVIDDVDAIDLDNVLNDNVQTGDLIDGGINVDHVELVEVEDLIDGGVINANDLIDGGVVNVEDLDIKDNNLVDLDIENALNDLQLLNGGVVNVDNTLNDAVDGGVLNVDNTLNDLDLFDNDGEFLTENDVDILDNLLKDGIDVGGVTVIDDGVNVGDVTLIDGDVLSGGILNDNDVATGDIVSGNEILTGPILTDLVGDLTILGDDLTVIGHDLVVDDLIDVGGLDLGGCSGCDGQDPCQSSCGGSDDGCSYHCGGDSGCQSGCSGGSLIDIDNLIDFDEVIGGDAIEITNISGGDILSANDITLNHLVTSTSNGDIVNVGDVTNNDLGCPGPCAGNSGGNLANAVTVGGVTQELDLSNPVGGINVQIPAATSGGNISNVIFGGDAQAYGSTGSSASTTSNTSNSTAGSTVVNNHDIAGSGCSNCHNSQVTTTRTIASRLHGGALVLLPGSNFAGGRFAGPLIHISKSGGHLVSTLASRPIRSALNVKAFPNTGAGMSNLTDDEMLIWLALASMALAAGGAGLRWSNRRPSLSGVR